MAKTRSQKETMLARITADIAGQGVVLAGYKGLTVKESSELRDKGYDAQLQLTVVKNTLLNIALKNAGIEADQSIMDQPIIMVASKTDEVTLAKTVQNFADEHEKMQIFGGIVEGKYVDASTIKMLSQLPGREELLAKVVGSINAPLSGLVNVLAGNLRGLVSVLSQYQQKISQ